MSTAAPSRTCAIPSGQEDGFTLVELLVVMLVIGVLAGIAIPTFLHQRDQGWRTALRSDLKNAAVAAESLSTRSGGGYAGLTTASLRSERGDGVTTGVSVTVVGAAADGYCLAANDDQLPTETWFYDSARGAPSREACA